MSLCLKQSQIVCKNLPCNQDVIIFKATVKKQQKIPFSNVYQFFNKRKGLCYTSTFNVNHDFT